MVALASDVDPDAIGERLASVFAAEPTIAAAYHRSDLAAVLHLLLTAAEMEG